MGKDRMTKVKDRGFKTVEGEQEIVRFTSIEQAHNYLDEYEKEYPKENYETYDKKGATIAPRKDRIKYLEYGISLLNPFKDEKEILLLTLRVRGYPAELIARYLKVPVSEVNKIEKQAMVKVKYAITKVKENCIPILGG